MSQLPLFPTSHPYYLMIHGPDRDVATWWKQARQVWARRSGQDPAEVLVPHTDVARVKTEAVGQNVVGSDYVLPGHAWIGPIARKEAAYETL